MCISMMKNCSSVSVYVVVNFLSQVIFVFLLFLGMVMYPVCYSLMKLKQRKNKNNLREKINYNIYFTVICGLDCTFDLLWMSLS